MFLPPFRLFSWSLSALTYLHVSQDTVNCIKTIYILLLADASMLSLNRASLLLPYLRGASTVRPKACSCTHTCGHFMLIVF